MPEEDVEQPARSVTATGPVKVLLVDDHQVVLEGLVSMLASQRERVAILGATTEPGEALRLAGELEPDIVLLDIRLKGASGLDLCQELNRRHPLQRLESPSTGISAVLHIIGLVSFSYSYKYLVDYPSMINESYGWHFQYLTIIGTAP